MSRRPPASGESDPPQPSAMFPGVAPPGNALGNVELVAAIEAVAARDNQFTRRALFETLRRAELVLAVEGAELVLAISEDDEAYVPAFSDVGAMRAAFPGAYDPRLEPATVVFELVLAGDCAGLALNPAGPIGGILTRDDVASLVEDAP